MILRKIALLDIFMLVCYFLHSNELPTWWLIVAQAVLVLTMVDYLLGCVMDFINHDIAREHVRHYIWLLVAASVYMAVSGGTVASLLILLGWSFGLHVLTAMKLFKSEYWSIALCNTVDQAFESGAPIG